jgi:hypothetical protein
MFPVKNGLKKGDDLSPLLFNCTVQCAIRRVQVNPYDLKLMLIYGVEAYILQRQTQQL